MLNKSEFGDLVKAYRKQRGWTQEELAEHWGHTSAYISQIESGRRKLDSVSQAVRLADILDIPSEKLEAIGRGIPQRKMKATSSKEADSAILQMLLAPGKDMVRLSYIVWMADKHTDVENDMHGLIIKLDEALTSYHGEFMKPAQELLAYAHTMQGRVAYDRLDFAAAAGHFSEMIDLGNELNDADVITLGMTYQGDVLRKRGRYETALRCFEAAGAYAKVASSNVQGKYHCTIARAHYMFGEEPKFLRAIDAALEVADGTKASISSIAGKVTLDEVLCEKAAGFARLWKPEKSLEIFKETDTLRPFRPLRELGSYTMEKALAYLYQGDLDRGIKLSLKGLQLASAYQSKRHIKRLDVTYNRLKVMPIGKDRRLNTLHEAIIEAQRKQNEW